MIVNSIYGQTFSLSADIYENSSIISLFSHNYPELLFLFYPITANCLF